MDTIPIMAAKRQEADIGLSGSKTTQQQTQTSGPSAAALPHINAGTDALKGAYAGVAPQASAIGSSLFDDFNDFSAGTQPSRDYLSGIISSGGSGANPELDNIVRTTGNSVADRVNAIFSKAGQTGSSRQIGELGARLSENESNLRYQDSENQKSRVMQAISAAMGLDSSEVQNKLALAGGATGIPLAPAATLASGLGSLRGNAQTSTGSGTTTQSGNIFQSLLGLGGAALGGWASGGFRT